MHVDEKYLKALDDVYKMEQDFDDMFKTDVNTIEDLRKPKEVTPTTNTNPNTLISDIQSELDDIDKIFNDIDINTAESKQEENPQDNI